nr:hypothetical protein [Propionivibrio sp.]
MGSFRLHDIGQQQTVFDVIDRIHKQGGLVSASGCKINTRCVAVKDLETKLAQLLDLVRIVIQNHCIDAIGKQQAAYDLRSGQNRR